jgi:C4-dicarboxylate transporter DctM subunit
MVRTAVTTSVVLLLMATGRVISWLLSAQEIPAGLASFMTSLTDSRMLFLILCMIFLLLVGCLLDASAALIMLVPILAPIAVAYDVHPLHFALLVIVNLSIGMITPPVGVLLFVTCGIAKVSMEAMLKVIWPYVIMQIALLFVIAFIPEITLVVPRWLGYL